LFDAKVDERLESAVQFQLLLLWTVSVEYRLIRCPNGGSICYRRKSITT